MLASISSTRKRYSQSPAGGLSVSRCICSPNRNKQLFHFPLACLILDSWWWLWSVPSHGWPLTYVVEGTKDYYNGTSLIRASNNSIIYIAINYRVITLSETKLISAWCFWISRLAHSNVKWSSKCRTLGSTSCSRLDRAIYLSAQRQSLRVYPLKITSWQLFSITVVGESAGAGSILHHLTAPPKPLFQRAILQSPAFQAQ